MALVTAERDAWLGSAIAPTADGVIVDIGCGSGALAAVLDEGGIRPGRFLGIDLLEERVAAARAVAPWAEFFVGSADAIPLDDGADPLSSR